LGVNDRQIKISTALLREMLVEAYQSGWYGVKELDGDTADSIIEKRIIEDMFVKMPPPQPVIPFVGVAQPLIASSLNGMNFNVNGWGNQPNNIIISSDPISPVQITNGQDHLV
jgi:hypothetical protein